MPTRDDLWQIVERDGLTPDSVGRLSLLGWELFDSSPALSTFVAHAIFAKLANNLEEWDQPVSSDFKDRSDELRNRLLRWLGTEDAFNNQGVMNSVSVALADLLREIN